MTQDQLSQWLGKEQTIETTISAETARLMQATLNRDPTLTVGDELPPAWHWLYFHEPVRAADLGVEGHPALGRFMPPIRLGGGAPPRRMWAGGKLVFERPLHLGDQALKRSTIQAITSKEGRSGKLVFVGVAHEVCVAGECCLREEQTIVYRQPVEVGGGMTTAERAPTAADFSASYQPDPIMLFRYSALTSNGHRIHYDVDFCHEHEGYPNLVIHGPLIATLILDLFSRQFPGRQIAIFEYRGRSPLFLPHTFSVHGTAEGGGWASSHKGDLAMSARVVWA